MIRDPSVSFTVPLQEKRLVRWTHAVVSAVCALALLLGGCTKRDQNFLQNAPTVAAGGAVLVALPFAMIGAASAHNPELEEQRERLAREQKELRKGRRAVKKATSCPRREASHSTDWLSDEALLALFSETASPAMPSAKPQEGRAADDGCAFAGTWRYDTEMANGRIEGTFVVQAGGGQIQAVHGFFGEEHADHPQTASCPYWCCEICYSGSSCRRGYYVRAYAQEDGRAATGTSYSPAYGTGQVEFLLSGDGQGLDVTFQAPARYFTAHATKVEAGTCNKPVPYIEEAAQRAQTGN